MFPVHYVMSLEYPLKSSHSSHEHRYMSMTAVHIAPTDIVGYEAVHIAPMGIAGVLSRPILCFCFLCSVIWKINEHQLIRLVTNLSELMLRKQDLEGNNISATHHHLPVQIKSKTFFYASLLTTEKKKFGGGGGGGWVVNYFWFKTVWYKNFFFAIFPLGGVNEPNP